MIDMLSSLVEDLAPFSDLGTDAPTGIEKSDTYVVHLSRNGQDLELIFSANSVIERSENEEKRHSGMNALLASPNFADLGRWADNQKLSLKRAIDDETLPINGRSGNIQGGIEVVDEIIANGIKERRRNTIVLVDGPAGIGKTSFIKNLAFQRSSRYRIKRHPLLLHVESRGRMLQNLTDLMAFSLQTLRVPVTYDQIPVLVKQGLVTLAIDGFDELGDPNGYEMAWAQLNELISSTRGRGSIILSGRETFISAPRIKAALPSIDVNLDSLSTFTLEPISPGDARSWLRDEGWTDATLSAEVVEPLFEEGAYALRPFFLRQLAAPEIAEQIELGSLEDIMSFLVHAMLNREQNKFGKDVEAVTNEQERIEFLTALMEEVARDLADNQTDAISSETLAWLSEAVSENLPHEVRGILKNRANVIAFLTDDARRGFRRFIHEQVQNYFLCHVIIKSILGLEIPKFMRRNIIGTDFLDSFSQVFANINSYQAETFIRIVSKLLNDSPDVDRTRRNLAAILLAACSVNEIPEGVVISDVSIEEAFITETVSNVTLSRVTIAQLDARGCDMTQLEFADECYLVSVIADEGTIPTIMPLPAILTLPSVTLTKKEEISFWLSSQYRKKVGFSEDFSISDLFEKFNIFKLFSRLVRFRPFWLKDTDDKAARRILDDPDWENLKEILLRYNMLVERYDVPSSGRPSAFYHLRNREAFVNLDSPPDEVKEMLIEILRWGVDHAEI